MAKATSRVATVDAPKPNGQKLEEVVQTITISRLERALVEIPIRGETPLIMQRWSEKSRQQMLEAQQPGTRRKKDARDPEADYQAAFYRLDDGTPGMPATAFKAAIADAARFYDGVTMVSLKTAIAVKGIGSEQLVPIVGDYRMREDTPRNANGVADLRYRPEFWPWSATLLVEYLPSMLDGQSVWNLTDAAGRVGVGSWRPSSPKSKSGTFGQFRVAD
jgi:hypothetical protein